MYEPVGCDQFATDVICNEFLTNRESTLIGHIATDGDSAAFRGVQKAMREYGQTVEALTDTRQVGTLSSPRRRKRTLHNLARTCSLGGPPVRGRTQKEIFRGPNKEVHSWVCDSTEEILWEDDQHPKLCIRNYRDKVSWCLPQICIIIMSKSLKYELF